jgi:hypothetical protein
MPSPPKQKENIAECPVCGGEATRGCLYGADEIPLRWLDGAPTLGKNFRAATAAGVPVGRQQLFAGTHALGVRCSTCHNIVIEYGKT